MNEANTYNTDEGTAPSPMAKPQRPGMNPEDLRDPQSVPYPHPTPSGL